LVITFQDETLECLARDVRTEIGHSGLTPSLQPPAACSPGGRHEDRAGRTRAAWSAHAPVAYIEAEFFGGTDKQHAQVWDNSTVVLDPLHLYENEPFPITGTRVSQALRRLERSRATTTSSTPSD
jgi:hypothetical protein